MKGKPSMIRSGEFGKKAIAIISKTVRIFTKSRSRSVLKPRAFIVVVFIVMVLISEFEGLKTLVKM